MQPPLPDPTTADSKEEKTDALSILSDRTLCASPEPDEPVRTPGIPRVPCGVPLEPAACEAHVEQSMRVKTRSVSAVALTLWTIVFALSVVEDFRMTKTQSPAFQSRIMLAWTVCSGIFVVVAIAMFSSTLPRRPSRSFVKFLRGFTITMSVTSAIIGFGVLFPVLIECPTAVCESDEDRVLRLFVCLGVPVVTVWTWVWIPVMRRFVAEMAT